MSGVPARRPVFGAAELVADGPGAFLYDLGVPAAASGVSLGGLDPRRSAVSLGGVPASDLLSGRPALELLPLDVLAPLRMWAGFGEAVGVAADLRAFAASVPVTELRYRTGGNGIQFISATHAQTRRPGFVRALGGDRARLQALFHVSGRSADGEYAGVGVRGWQAIGRVGLALPWASVEITERHGRDRAGASGGVAPLGPFETVFDRDGATVLDRAAERETIRNDLAATLRVPLAAEPLTATAFWTAETFRYVDPALLAEADTVGARADRVGLQLEQPVRFGAHRLRARASGWVTQTKRGTAFPNDDRARTLHLAVLDSVALAGFGLEAEAGVTVAPETTFPVLGARLGRSLGATQIFAEARLAGATYGRMERDGFGTLVEAVGPVGRERTLRLAAGLDTALGPFDLGLHAEAVQQADPRVLLADPDTARFVTVSGAFRRATGTVRLGWRDRAARGVYLRLRANASGLLNSGESELHGRAAEVLPPLWGTMRLGLRALGLFDGNLDLDLAARGRAWTAFRGRSFHAPTALFALRPLDARPVDASGTLDLLAEAGIGGGRATVFIAYENILASRAYAGAYVVPVYPLPNPRLRFGVFWLLPG